MESEHRLTRLHLKVSQYAEAVDSIDELENAQAARAAAQQSLVEAENSPTSTAAACAFAAADGDSACSGAVGDWWAVPTLLPAFAAWAVAAYDHFQMITRDVAIIGAGPVGIEMAVGAAAAGCFLCAAGGEAGGEHDVLVAADDSVV